MLRRWLLGLWFVCGAAWADGPQDNVADKVRPVPPPGIQLPAEERQALQAEVDALDKEIDALRTTLAKKPVMLELVPDVVIYRNAVYYALKYDEFFKKAEIDVARKLLAQGRERAKSLHDGQAPWTTATGLVVRGYVSKIDGSVQPYGLVVPASYRAGTAGHHRLDLWYHGRGETLSELNFIDGRQKSPGEFTPPHAFVLHPYGRYCNANHFAGEIDTFEALDHAKKHYPIDEDRIVVRGFSMGGAACWNFAVHYADRWAAAAPGAGFSETPDFLKVFQNETLKPTWWEQKLWHWYDCTDWALNLAHCPTVAYSGEKDKQKQAADVMAKACEGVGIDLVHVIGQGAGHSYTPAAKAEINRRIDSVVARGRNAAPGRVHFTTWTLRYPRMHWLTVEGLGKHWERARVRADVFNEYDSRGVAIDVAENVTALTLSFPPGSCPFDVTFEPIITTTTGGGGIKRVPGPKVKSDRSWTCHLQRDNGEWKVVLHHDESLRKKPGLQGPIDDAFMDRFVMVRPTGSPHHDATGKWVQGEMRHAVDHWRKQFRGELTPKDDTAVTDDDIASSNLVLWGDPASNKVLAKLADKLPIKWTAKIVTVMDKAYDAATHVPVLIYPNPLNPKKYVVLNSGFTFREYDYLNNARQVPKLPDWAVLDVTRPPTSRTPAGIAAAGFFGERWELPSDK